MLQLQKYVIQVEKFLKGNSINLADIQQIDMLAKTLKKHLSKILPVGPDIIAKMNYSEAIKWFVDNKPQDTEFSKAAMLLMDDDEYKTGNMFIQVFLDNENNLICDKNEKPYGRRIVVEAMDGELEDLFRDNNLVIVE